ncbi:hypothetical protein E4T56_gene5990 [Termitomyces sp. T112]|nr:hypothetical protein E4T56_gene5990 [Termitomyces sp. T112]
MNADQSMLLGLYKGLFHHLNELHPMPLAWACSSCFIPDPTSLCLVFVFLTQCFIPDPTSLCSTQPHFVWLGLCLCISNSVLYPRPNLTSFGLCISNSVLHPRPNLTSFG